MRLFRVISISCLFAVLSACGDENARDGETSDELGINFIAPAGTDVEDVAASPYNIRVEITGATAEATYTLNYEATSCSFAGGTEIAADISADDTSTSWDVSTLNGIYCVYATLTDGTKSVVASSGQVNITI